MKKFIPPKYLRIPNPLLDFKIANPAGEEDHYHDKRYEQIPHTIGESFNCVYRECANTPQTVCPECVEYICADHLYRHPNCEAGR